MGFFDNPETKLGIDPLDPPEETEHNLRRCQLGAFWSLKGHFTASTEPAIVSIPTGGGKTALMMLSAFCLGGDQILVITPSDFLRKQTEDKFNELDGLGNDGADILRGDIGAPSVVAVNEQVTDESHWEELLEHDVVIALPDDVSTEYDENIIPPPTDEFDMAFFDEAHHTRAKSWQELVRHLDVEDVKEVLLTATPFRRDRRSLPGRLVYHYPVDRAIDDGIYEKIEYAPIDKEPETERNAQLCAAAAQRLESANEDRSVDNKLQILAKVEEKSDADGLVEPYKKVGLDVRPIHSGRTDEHNDEVETKLRNGQIDGIIAVGMMGEGIDVDNLSVAVMHDPPQSFPLTLQLFGRIARPVENATAAVIADPDQIVGKRKVREIVQRLYRQSDGWGRLITGLVDEVLKENTGWGMRGVPVFGIRINDLEPYFSVNLYDLSSSWKDVNRDADINIPRGKIRRFETDQKNLICMTTLTRESPDWTSGDFPISREFNLHIYYYHHRSGVLFERTTSDRLAKRIRETITKGSPEPIRGAPLTSVLNEDEMEQYLTAGLRGGPASVGGAPDYKMYMGRRAENAVDPSDRDSFAHGHSFTRLEGGEIHEQSDVSTLGLSERQGSVWSSNRDNLHEFKLWCQRVARRIDRDAEFARIGGLGIQVTQDIDRFPVGDDVGIELLHVALDFQANLDDVRYKRIDEGTGYQDADDLGFEVANTNIQGDWKVTVYLHPAEDTDPIECTYYVGRNAWRGDTTNYRFEIEPGTAAEAVEIPGQQFLERYPPEFFLSDGSVVKYGRMFKRDVGSASFPATCFDRSEDIDWSECDRTAESNDAEVADGKQSLHDWTESYIIDDEAEDQVVFKDHSAGEIADFIEINGVEQPPDHEKQISFYHCKVTTKSGGDDPSIGAAQKHVADALYQLHRTLNWVENRGLIDHIDDREDSSQPHFVKGKDTFETFEKEFKIGEWTYEVVFVNPCLDYQEALEDEKVNMILRACYETLEVDGADVNFRIIGHQDT